MRPCFYFAIATADDISFFPAYSHLHFPVYCVVSRPFLRKATRDSSDDVLSLYSHCVERKPLKIPFNLSPKTLLRPKLEKNCCLKQFALFWQKNSPMYLCFALFWREIWAGACEKRRAHVLKTITDTMTIFSFTSLFKKLVAQDQGRAREKCLISLDLSNDWIKSFKWYL